MLTTAVFMVVFGCCSPDTVDTVDDSRLRPPISVREEEKLGKHLQALRKVTTIATRRQEEEEVGQSTPLRRRGSAFHVNRKHAAQTVATTYGSVAPVPLTLA